MFKEWETRSLIHQLILIDTDQEERVFRATIPGVAIIPQTPFLFFLDGQVGTFTCILQLWGYPITEVWPVESE